MAIQLQCCLLGRPFTLVSCLCTDPHPGTALSSVFTALHVMQTRYSDENSVRLHPSVTRVIPDKTEERSVQICTPYERTFILVF